MNDVREEYRHWVIRSRFGPVQRSRGFLNLCVMLDEVDFLRRVGNDVNREIDAITLREDFLEASGLRLARRVQEDFLNPPASLFEVMVTLAERMDFLYDVGTFHIFSELVTNLGLDHVIVDQNDRSWKRKVVLNERYISAVADRINFSRFERDGHGGLFPLKTWRRGMRDQREVELWDQHADYFSERLKGALWTSTN